VLVLDLPPWRSHDLAEATSSQRPHLQQNFASVQSAVDAALYGHPRACSLPAVARSTVHSPGVGDAGGQ